MSNTKYVQAYTVASGIIVDQQRLLLVQNQRRNGSLDWSTPGGVVDPGEEVLEALQREVIEETSVVVDGWSSELYSVHVDFVGRDMTLHAQVFQAAGFSGELHVDDPDNVVVDGQWVDQAAANALLDASPQWVAEPLRYYLDSVMVAGGRLSTPSEASNRWGYRVTRSAAGFDAELVEHPDGV